VCACLHVHVNQCGLTKLDTIANLQSAIAAAEDGSENKRKVC